MKKIETIILQSIFKLLLNKDTVETIDCTLIDDGNGIEVEIILNFVVLF